MKSLVLWLLVPLWKNGIQHLNCGSALVLEMKGFCYPLVALNLSRIHPAACIKEGLPWRLLKADQKIDDKALFPWNCSITDLPVLLFFVLLFLHLPCKRKWFDEVSCHWDKWASLQTAEELSSRPQCTFGLPSLGMTMEVLGTLIGAALQGQIVASAHVSHHCTVNPTVNTTDSWHDTPSFPEPSDPLSHQVSVCGSTLKFLRKRGGGVSVIPYHIIQPDKHEHDFLEISNARAEKTTLLQTRLPIYCLCNHFSAWQQNYTEELCWKCQTVK